MFFAFQFQLLYMAYVIFCLRHLYDDSASGHSAQYILSRFVTDSSSRLVSVKPFKTLLR